MWVERWASKWRNGLLQNGQLFQRKVTNKRVSVRGRSFIGIGHERDRYQQTLGLHMIVWRCLLAGCKLKISISFPIFKFKSQKHSCMVSSQSCEEQREWCTFVRHYKKPLDMWSGTDTNIRRILVRNLRYAPSWGVISGGCKRMEQHRIHGRVCLVVDLNVGYNTHNLLQKYKSNKGKIYACDTVEILRFYFSVLYTCRNKRLEVSMGIVWTQIGWSKLQILNTWSISV